MLASGVTWRKLATPGADRLLGRGVYYGAARTEALAARGKDVFLIGGGNSAGQAAMLFSAYARSVTILVRGGTLAASMSQYLIDELAKKENVRIELSCECVSMNGEQHLESLDVMYPEGKKRVPADAVFVFIGAEAETSWLPRELIRDERGFVCTGRDVVDLLPAGNARERDPYLLGDQHSGHLRSRRRAPRLDEARSVGGWRRQHGDRVRASVFEGAGAGDRRGRALVIVRESRYGYAETLAQLTAAITLAGNTIFAAIDQSAAALLVGMTLRPTMLLIFGNPQAGTPVMNAFPLSALDLPLKVAVWQDGATVQLAYVPMREIAQRYGITGMDERVAAIDHALSALADHVAKEAN